MAGIAGIIDPHLVGRGRLGSMIERMGRRGSQTSIFHDPGVAMAIRLRGAASPQPVVTDDFVVFLDGWLRVDGELATPSRGPQAVADAWKRWGVDLVRRVDEGNFVLAVWERKSRVLHLLRDSTGIKPLFWTQLGDRIAFASELPALLELPWVSRRLDRQRVAEYLSFGVVHAPRTLLESVRQLEPGRRLRFREGDHTLRAWDIPEYAPPGTAMPRPTDVVPALQEAVERAVRVRLPRGGSTPGIFLSGGVGSMAVATATRALSQSLSTFTVSFDDERHPEVPFGGRVANLLGMEHHAVHVGTQRFAHAFPEAVRALGHPIGSPSVLLQLELARQAAESVGIVLTGDGADELFGGAKLGPAATWLRQRRQLDRLPYLLRRVAKRGLGNTVAGRWSSVDLDRFGLELGLGGRHLFTTPERRKLLHNEDHVRPDIRAHVLAPFYEEVDTDPLNKILHAWTRSELIESTLARVDRTAAQFGVEPRYPLMDQGVRRLAHRLPGEFKLSASGSNLRTRWLLRASLKGAVPHALLNRPDRGLPRPLDDWLAGPGRLFFEAQIDLLKQDRFGLFARAAVDELKLGVLQRKGTGVKLWALFILDAWLREIRAT